MKYTQHRSLCLSACAIWLTACNPATQPPVDSDRPGTGGTIAAGGSGGQTNGATSSSGGNPGAGTGGGGGGSGGVGAGATGGQTPLPGAGSGGSAGGTATDAGGPDTAVPPVVEPAKDAASAADQAPGDVAPPPGPQFPPTGGACPPGPFGDPLPANRTATLIKAAGSLEGPVWVAAQNALYFCVVSDVAKGGRIDKFLPATNTFSTFVSGVDVAGLALSPQGALVAASFDSRNMTSFDLGTGKRTSIPGSDSFMGNPLDQTNDLVIRSDGNIYFTDTDYRQDGRAGQDTTATYWLSTAGKLTRVGSGSEPNGIALSPDGHWLYVSSTGGDPLRRYALDDTGAPVGAPTSFSSSSSDGMGMDCAGNLYLSTGGGIRVLGPDGKMLGTITGLGGATVSNAAFGGPDYKTLFVTTAAALYQIKMNVPGFPN